MANESSTRCSRNLDESSRLYSDPEVKDLLETSESLALSIASFSPRRPGSVLNGRTHGICDGRNTAFANARNVLTQLSVELGVAQLGFLVRGISQLDILLVDIPRFGRIERLGRCGGGGLAPQWMPNVAGRYENQRNSERSKSGPASSST